MPKDAESLLAHLRRNKTGKRATDLDELLSAFGFESRDGGKHRLYFHPEFPMIVQTVTRSSGELDPGYIRSAVEKIDALKLARKQAEDRGTK